MRILIWLLLLPYLQSAGIKEDASKVLYQKKFKWINLTDSELPKWYNPTDLCILNSTDFRKFPQQTRADDCRQYSRGNRRQFCGVGMGNNNYPCYGPFGSSRPHFKRGVEGYTNAALKPLLTLFTYLHLTNTTLVLLGDSTMRQKLQALACELTREVDGEMWSTGELFGVVPCQTMITFYFPSEKNRKFKYPPVSSLFASKNSSRSSSSSVHPLANQAITVYAISLGPKSIDCYTNLLKKEKKMFMNITNDYQFKNETTSSKASTQEQQFSDKEKLDHIETHGTYGNAAYWINDLNFQQHRSVFILANMGLWYNEEGGYLTAVKPVLDWLLSVGRRKISDHEGNTFHNTMVWHETLRQHWYNSYQTGYYNSYESNQYMKNIIHTVNASTVPFEELASPFLCAKVTNVSAGSDWRNEIVQTVFENNLDFQKYIHSFPISEITK
jgi:hypothetical protein